MFFIKFLKLVNINNSIVFDIYYHRRTVYYLTKFNIFTIAPVGLSYDSRVVDLAIPSSLDSSITHIFFLKLIVSVLKVAECDLYSQTLNYWVKF
jgi:hypothetical protein